MYFELSFNEIMPPCAQGIILHQESFSQITLCLSKYAYNRLLRIRLYKCEPASMGCLAEPGFLLASLRSLLALVGPETPVLTALSGIIGL